MNLSVVGLGIVSKIGDVADIEKLLTAQNQLKTGDILTDSSLVLDTPEDFKFPGGLLRRINHFAKLSLVSACRAIKDSEMDYTEKKFGIIQGSVYGPIVAGLKAFDELIDFGDNQLSPTNFSGSVFNTAATYLSLALNIQGATLSHTSGLDTLYNSLLTAALWLETGEMDYVIVGVGDEYTNYFDCQGSKGSAQLEILPTAEGWTTFILGKSDKAKYGKVTAELMSGLPNCKNQKNIYSVWHEQRIIAEFSKHAADNQGCFPALLRGSYPSGTAFDLALALICAKTKIFPVGNCLTGSYQMVTMAAADQINCYSIAENHQLVNYQVLT